MATKCRQSFATTVGLSLPPLNSSSYGLSSYGLSSYGLSSYGLSSYGPSSNGLSSYGPSSYGLNKNENASATTGGMKGASKPSEAPTQQSHAGSAELGRWASS